MISKLIHLAAQPQYGSANPLGMEGGGAACCGREAHKTFSYGSVILVVLTLAAVSVIVYYHTPLF